MLKHENDGDGFQQQPYLCLALGIKLVLISVGNQMERDATT